MVLHKQLYSNENNNNNRKNVFRELRSSERRRFRRFWRVASSQKCRLRRKITSSTSMSTPKPTPTSGLSMKCAANVNIGEEFSLLLVMTYVVQ